MRSDASKGATFQQDNEDFSLVLGGPLFQFFLRAHLSGSTLELLHRRAVFLTTLAWLPLLVLTILEGHAWTRDVRVPFLYDADTHVRFLLVLPLLIGSESIVHNRMRLMNREFLGLVPDNFLKTFSAAIASTKRWRNSLAAELVLLAIVYAVGLEWREYVALDVSGWYGVPVNGRLHPSVAGWWLRLVSVPIVQFLLLRWYYRLFIWARFLWQVSRIKLNLLPAHPDRSGGLGFLGNVPYAFAPLLMAQGLLLSGMMANQIFYAGASLLEFRTELIAIVALMVFVVLGPSLVFSLQLDGAKREGLRQYGILAQLYVRAFDNRWLRGGLPSTEALLGNSDVQSLADLGHSFEVVKEMRLVPFSARSVLILAVLTLAPVAPLLLTVVPFGHLVDRLVKIII